MEDKQAKNKVPDAMVIVTVILIIGTIVSYVVIISMLTGGPTPPPLDLYASVSDSHNVNVIVASAPSNAPLAGSRISVVNNTTGHEFCPQNVVVLRNNNIVASGVPLITTDSKLSWYAGDVILLSFIPDIYVSVGDEVHITGSGFAHSMAKITA
ncbi:MAG: hypothetical protein QW620_06290 [Thermoplasmata archaeon]